MFCFYWLISFLILWMSSNFWWIPDGVNYTLLNSGFCSVPLKITTLESFLVCTVSVIYVYFCNFFFLLYILSILCLNISFPSWGQNLYFIHFEFYSWGLCLTYLGVDDKKQTRVIFLEGISYYLLLLFYLNLSVSSFAL